MKIKPSFLISAIMLLVVMLTNTVSAQKKAKTRRQIEALIKEKKSRTFAEEKIDSQLLQAVRENQGRKMAPGVDLEAANVHADSKGNLQVDINADVNDLLIDRIKALGGVIIFPSKEYHTIKAEINLSMVIKIAGYPEVKFIAPAALSHLNNPIAPRNVKVVDKPY